VSIYVRAIFSFPSYLYIVGPKKYRSDLEADRKKSEVSPCISTNFEWPTFSDMNIYENSDFMRKKINQKFAWLKVASINISRRQCLIAPPFGWLRFLVGQKWSSSSLVILKSHPMLPAYFCHVPFMKISTSCLLNFMLFIKYFESDDQPSQIWTYYIRELRRLRKKWIKSLFG
jgi:hypothetical protein